MEIIENNWKFKNLNLNLKFFIRRSFKKGYKSFPKKKQKILQKNQKFEKN